MSGRGTRYATGLRLRSSCDRPGLGRPRHWLGVRGSPAQSDPRPGNAQL